MVTEIIRATNQAAHQPMTPRQLISRKLYNEISITEEEFSNMIIGPEADDHIEELAELKLQEFRPTL